MPIFGQYTTEEEIREAAKPEHTELVLQVGVQRNTILKIPANITTLLIYSTVDPEIIRLLSGIQFNHIQKVIIYPNHARPDIIANVINLLPQRINNITIEYGSVHPSKWGESILDALRARGINPIEQLHKEYSKYKILRRRYKVKNRNTPAHSDSNNQSTTSHRQDTNNVTSPRYTPGLTIFNINNPFLLMTNYQSPLFPNVCVIHRPQNQINPLHISQSASTDIIFELTTPDDFVMKSDADIIAAQGLMSINKDNDESSSSTSMDTDDNNEQRFQVMEFSLNTPSSDANYKPRGRISINELIDPVSPTEEEIRRDIRPL